MQSRFPDRALPPSLSPFSSARSEAQTLKGRDRKRARRPFRHGEAIHVASLAQTHEFANRSGHRSDAPQLRCRARAHGRGALSEEDGNREAGTVDWAGEKNVCSAYACPALRLLGTPSLPTRLGDSSSAIATRIKNFGVWGVHAKHNQATPCNTMQNHVMPCKNRVKKLPVIRARMAENAPTKKNWARKKRMASWARQRQQITEAADGGARARTGADCAVVLGLRAALARGRAADPCGPALLLPPGPAASQQGL